MSDIKLTKGAVFLTIWSLFLFIFPFYLLPSGLPQPSDWLLAICFVLALPLMFSSVSKSGFKGILLLFTAYVITVNFSWSIILSTLNINKNSLFYLFNLLTVLFITSIKDTPGFWRVTSRTLTATVLFQAFLFLFSSGQGLRETLFFNNPNQLGYWCLIITILLIVLQKAAPVHRLLHILALGIIGFFSLLSLSKGAIIPCFLLLFAYIIRIRRIRWVFFTLLLLVLPNLPWSNIASGDIYTNKAALIYWRFASIGTENDSFGGRGYSRITNYPQYLLLGAGEGRYDRFAQKRGIEIHSSLGTALFSYGLPGITLLLTILGLVFFKGDFMIKVCVLALVAYSITHMGLRFSLFWVALTLMYYLPTNWKKSVSSA